MSDIFFAYIPSDEIIDFQRKHYDDVGIIFPHGTLLTRKFLQKERGYKRIKVDFDDISHWNTQMLTKRREMFPRDAESFVINAPDSVVEIWGNPYKHGSGVEILDRIRLYPKDADYLDDWLPLHKVTVMSKEPFHSIQDLSFNEHPFIEFVKLDTELTYVGCHSFSNCPNLKKVVIGEKAFLNGNANRAFCNDPNLCTFIIVPDANSRLREDVYPSADIENCMNGCEWFRNCPKLSHLIIADTTRLIRIEYDRS